MKRAACAVVVPLPSLQDFVAMQPYDEKLQGGQGFLSRVAGAWVAAVHELRYQDIERERKKTHTHTQQQKKRRGERERERESERERERERCVYIYICIYILWETQKRE